MSPRMMTSKLTPSGITAQILLFILSLPITCRPSGLTAYMTERTSVVTRNRTVT